MHGFTRLIIGMLVIGWMGSAVHAQVVLNMPPPKSKQLRSVINTSPGSVGATSAEAQAPDQPPNSVRVGDIALARYGRARSLPRSDYGYGGRYWQSYAYSYPYSYGYYPFHIGFGHFTFAHHSHHHHHEMGMGGGD